MVARAFCLVDVIVMMFFVFCLCCGCVNKHLRVLCIPRLVSGTTLGET